MSSRYNTLERKKTYNNFGSDQNYSQEYGYTFNIFSKGIFCGFSNNWGDFGSRWRGCFGVLMVMKDFEIVINYNVSSMIG